MCRGLVLIGVCWLLSGCAVLAPASSLIGPLSGGSSPLQVHDQTSVNLARDNFVLVKTNLVGRSQGFSLLGLITIVPASLTTAMNRMYAAAEMRPGKPQTVAHLIIERNSSYWILFGIPRIQVRADVVEFRPQATTRQRAKPKRASSTPVDQDQSR